MVNTEVTSVAQPRHNNTLKLMTKKKQLEIDRLNQNSFQ
jgi:hypothetical protein